MFQKVQGTVDGSSSREHFADSSTRRAPTSCYCTLLKSTNPSTCQTYMRDQELLCFSRLCENTARGTPADCLAVLLRILHASTSPTRWSNCQLSRDWYVFQVIPAKVSMLSQEKHKVPGRTDRKSEQAPRSHEACLPSLLGGILADHPGELPFS